MYTEVWLKTLGGDLRYRVETPDAMIAIVSLKRRIDRLVKEGELVEIETFSVTTSSKCMDCKIQTIPGDYFCVKDDLWRSVTKRGERRGMLCRSCLEARMGRSLKTKDFEH